MHFCRYLDTLQALNKEAGSVVSKYEVCDNIDLSTILQVNKNTFGLFKWCIGALHG